MKYAHLIRWLSCTPLAIEERKWQAIRSFLQFAAEGGRLSADEVAARIAPAREREAVAAIGDVAVLPIVGVISQRGGTLEGTSESMVSTEQLSRQLRALAADPAVKAIVLDVDSPGGSTSGVDELAREIHELRGAKPIVAVANAWAASAAYWIASAAEELIVTPSGEVGSIGVFAEHWDMSEFLRSKGVKPTLVKAGKFKAEMHPDFPMTPEAVAHLQESVDYHYELFVKAVARNRNAAQKDVREGFGEGAMVDAPRAVKLGMADRVGTLRETIERFGGSTAPAPKRRRAHAALLQRKAALARLEP